MEMTPSPVRRMFSFPSDSEVYMWLTAPQSESPVGLPDLVNVQTPDCIPQVKKLMNPTAPTVHYMLQSLVPNWTPNAMHYRLTPSQATTNLRHLHDLFTTVGYTPSHWKPLLREQALKWGAHLPAELRQETIGRQPAPEGPE